MELESATQPAWLRLQTKVVSAMARMQSLHSKHPLKQWIAKARKTTELNQKIVHLSNLENILSQFPLLTQDIEEVIPWKPPDQSTPSSKPTKKAIQAEVRKLADSKWNELWQAGDKPGNKTAPHLRRIVKDDLTQGRTLYSSVQQRSDCAILTQLRTGHCGLNSYLFRFNKAESAECPHCGYAKETVEHFLLECPVYWEERHVLRVKAGATKMTLSGLLGDKDVVSATLEYVRNTRRFSEEGGERRQFEGGNQMELEGQFGQTRNEDGELNGDERQIEG